MTDAALNREEPSLAVATSIPDWLWETDSRGCYTYSNTRVEDILGYRVDEIIGAHFLDVVDPRDGPEFSAILTGATRDKAPFSDVPKRARGKDGREVWLETSGRPLLSENGALTGYRGVDRDVTERRRRLERLPRSVRLAMVGPVGQAIDPGRSAFGRPGAGEPINLNRAVDEVLELLTARLVETHLAPDLLPISGSSALIGRAVAILLANARAEAGDRGAVVLKTENLYVDAPGGRDQRIEVGEYVRLEVSDPG
ncbi:MAG: PAS domain S-box protein, partial [Candidatus Dormibacteraceae bacterium]